MKSSVNKNLLKFKSFNTKELFRSSINFQSELVLDFNYKKFDYKCVKAVSYFKITAIEALINKRNVGTNVCQQSHDILLNNETL